MAAKICAVCNGPAERQFFVTVEGVNEGKTQRPYSSQVVAVCGNHLKPTHAAVVELVRAYLEDVVRAVRTEEQTVAMF